MKLEEGINETMHGKALCEKLHQLIKNEKSKYQANLIPDLTYINNLAECLTGIEIVSVEHSFDNEYSLYYKFDWSIYNGCVGMDEMGTINTHISFTVESDGSIHFDLSGLVERTTADEL